MSSFMNTLKICAFCPNPCRSALPTDGPAPKESRLPSAQSLLALYLVDGRVLDDSLLDTLADRDAVKVCQDRCVYGFDVDAAIAEALGKLSLKPVAEEATP